MTSKRSKASSDTVIIKECFVRLDRNFLLKAKPSKRNTGDDVELGGSEENDRNVAQENVSKKPKPKQDIESSASESEYSGNETSESDESESKTVSKINKKKQLQLNKDKHDEANRKSLACRICKEKFKTYNSFMKHQFSHKAKVFRCTICKESFKHRTSYMNHQKREHPERACYPCEFSGCDESFNTLARRRNHEKCHYKYMCRFCKKGYAKKAYMRLHVKEVHSTKI